MENVSFDEVVSSPYEPVSRQRRMYTFLISKGICKNEKQVSMLLLGISIILFIIIGILIRKSTATEPIPTAEDLRSIHAEEGIYDYEP